MVCAGCVSGLMGVRVVVLMIGRARRATQRRASAASDVYTRQSL